METDKSCNNKIVKSEKENKNDTENFVFYNTSQCLLEVQEIS